MDKEEVARTLSKWAHSGFSTSRAKLNTTGMVSPGGSPQGSLSIADFQVQLLKSASKKPGDKKEEEA